jgi:hypothetical protein
VVAEAASAQQIQILAYNILRDSAASEGGAGLGASDAAACLGPSFDYRASLDIEAGDFDLHLSAVETDLGYMPILHIALIYWRRCHRFTGTSQHGFLSVALGTTFRASGRFEPRAGLQKLEDAYAHATVLKERYNPHDAVLAILRAMLSAGSAVETETAAVTKGNHEYPDGLTWTSFTTATSLDATTRAERSDGEFGDHDFTSAELRRLMRTLRRLVDGHSASSDRIASQIKAPHIRVIYTEPDLPLDPIPSALTHPAQPLPSRAPPSIWDDPALCGPRGAWSYTGPAPPYPTGPTLRSLETIMPADSA